MAASMLLGGLLAFASIATVASQGTPTASPAHTATIEVPGCETVGASGKLLVQPVSPGGSPQRGLIVVDPANTREANTIDLPPVSAAFATALPERALAIAAGGLYLVDSAELTATPIPLGGEPAMDLKPNPVQFRGSAGRRYVLLGSPGFDRTFLIDVEAGQATNLTALMIPPTPDTTVSIPFAAVTPDDAHVVLWDGQHVYVVRTANPEGARQIDTGAFAFAPDFSPDGTEVVYSRSSGPGSGSTLMLESVDDERSVELISSEHALVTLWVPESRTILVDERTETGAAAGSVYLFDLDTGIETPLLDYTGSLSTVQFHPDGTHALFGTEQLGATTWHLADLESGTIDELSQLEGSRVQPGLFADTRWALAIPPSEPTDLLAGPVYRGVDLETGMVGRLFEQPDNRRFVQPPILSPDGRLSLVTGETDSSMTLWLLDASDLRATEIASGSSMTALFAPEACHIATTHETSIDGVPNAVSRIVPLSGNPPLEIEAGRALAWTASPTPVG